MVVINVIAGTAIAWVLVRDNFPGKRIVNSVIDLPFALPTVVAGITLLALYGTDSPLGVNIAFTRIGVVTALLFVTLPFVVRAVQPVLLELDREMEEAAASLGAGPLTTFRRVILPNLTPAILTGAALAFARAIGEFGSLILLSGNLPKTQVSSLFIFCSDRKRQHDRRGGGLGDPAGDRARRPALDRTPHALEPSACPLVAPPRGSGCGSSRSATCRCCS